MTTLDFHKETSGIRRIAVVIVSTTVCLLMIGVVTVARRDLTAKPSEPDWTPFSPELIQSYVAEEKEFVIFFCSGFDINSQIVISQHLSAPAVVAELARFQTVLAETSGNNPNSVHAQELLLSLDCTNAPTIAIYRSGDAEKPELLRGLVTKDRIISALTLPP